MMSKRATTDHGSARWATRSDLLEKWVGGRLFPSLVYKESLRPLPGAWMLNPAPWARGERIDLPSFNCGQHILYLGPTGSGKTTLILPNIIFAIACALVICDPKGEAWLLTSGYRKSAMRLAPLDPNNSACFNWIPPCKEDWHYALLMAMSIVEANGGTSALRFHREADAEILAGIMCHVACTEQPTPASLYDFLTHPAHTSGGWLKVLADSPSSHARDVATVISNSRSQVRGEAIMSLANMLGWLKDERVRCFTSASKEALDWGKLREERTALYWCLAVKDQAPLRTLTALFFNCALHGMMQASEGSKTKVKFVFDELANVGKIQNFSEHITTVRGMNIDFVMCLQSISQLAAIYGDDPAETIFTNALTKVVLGGITDTKILDQIVKLLGTQTVVRQRVTETKRGFWGTDRSKSVSDHELGVPLMDASQIERLPDDQQLVLIANRQPWVAPRFSWMNKGKAAAAVGLGAALTAYPKDGETVHVKDQKVWPNFGGAGIIPEK